VAKDPAEYRERAARCMENVDAVKDAASEEYWRRLAEDWLNLD
jgi:hypothetical protein